MYKTRQLDELIQDGDRIVLLDSDDPQNHPIHHHHHGQTVGGFLTDHPWVKAIAYRDIEGMEDRLEERIAADRAEVEAAALFRYTSPDGRPPVAQMTAEVMEPFDATPPVLTGIKYSSNKPAMGLLPPYALALASAGFAVGAEKYSAWNWTGGLRYTDLAGALLRHLNAFMAGEEMDDGPDGSGLPHLAGLMCSAMMLADTHARAVPGTDDRASRSDNLCDRLAALAIQLKVALEKIRAKKAGTK